MCSIAYRLDYERRHLMHALEAQDEEVEEQEVEELKQQVRGGRCVLRWVQPVTCVIV